MHRPAAVDALDDNQVRVGIPAYVDEEGGAAFKSRYFFAELVRRCGFARCFTLNYRPPWTQFARTCWCSIAGLVPKHFRRCAGRGAGTLVGQQMFWTLFRCVSQAKDVRNSVDLPASKSKAPAVDKAGSGTPAGSDKPMRSPIRRVRP